MDVLTTHFVFGVINCMSAILSYFIVKRLSERKIINRANSVLFWLGFFVGGVMLLTAVTIWIISLIEGRVLSFLQVIDWTIYIWFGMIPPRPYGSVSPRTLLFFGTLALGIFVGIMKEHSQAKT